MESPGCPVPPTDRLACLRGLKCAKSSQDDGTRVPVPGIYLAIASNEVSSRLNTMAAGGPASATYHNLQFDYGYNMDIPKRWYLDSESPVLSLFIPYAGRRLASIGTLPIIEPFQDRSTEFSLLADYLWDTFLPRYAAENWVFFQPISRTKVNVGGQEFYRLEYRARWTTGLCILDIVEMISVSSQFPNKPHLFITAGSICEDSLATYSAERETMLNSFRP